MILPYQPYFCEENAFRICEVLVSPDGAGVRRTLECGAPAPDAGPQETAEPADVAGALGAGGTWNAAAMLFIFSRGPWVTLYHQRAVAPGRPIYWDYHVVAVAEEAGTWHVFDPDSRLTPGISLPRYLEETFTVTGHHGDGAADPLFRWVPWETARSSFGSDRSHMRTPDGEWIEPPPPWPPINPKRNTLAAFLSRNENGMGQIHIGGSSQLPSSVPVSELSAAVPSAVPRSPFPADPRQA